MADVLVVVAHPDDESFAMGGRIVQMVASGSSLLVVALSDGTSARFPSPEYWDATEARHRRREHYKAALKVLGADELIHLEPVFPDQESDTVPQLHINRAVQKCVEIANPYRIYTHWIGDLNIDHRRTAEAVLVATRGMGAGVFAMAPEWPSRCVGPAWSPPIIVDISRVLAQKQAACRCYLDEIRTGDHPRNVETMEPFEYFYEYR